MTKEKSMSGVPTTFYDKDGNPIKIHDYVKDAEGNRYYINSHCQAVPEGDDAPAVELGRLIETTEVSLLGIEELLNAKPQAERRRRGGRRRKEEPVSPSKEELEAEAAAKAEAELEAARRAKEAAKAAAAEKEGTQDLHPVTEQMLLGVIPDDVLANELRRRGYTLCAVRPALIEL